MGMPAQPYCAIVEHLKILGRIEVEHRGYRVIDILLGNPNLVGAKMGHHYPWTLLAYRGELLHLVVEYSSYVL
jgi:hypothetical protein